jgi:hypothetical protein
MKYLLLMLVALGINAQDPWGGLQFLTGEWVGEGADGACSFTLDLERKVMVRKSYAESHKDLMVVYFEKGLKAIYFDNEDHVIHYTVESSPDSVRFLNEQYRLTYRKEGEKLLLDFDIAPPGKPFSNYLHAVLRKK